MDEEKMQEQLLKKQFNEQGRNPCRDLYVKETYEEVLRMMEEAEN